MSNGNCSACGTAIGTGTHCPNCGLAAGHDVCAACGDMLTPNATHCGSCGMAVSLSAAMSGAGVNAQAPGLLTGLQQVSNFFGHGPVSADTGQKIEDALAKMPSLADRNAEFLKSIGADPSKAALTSKQARAKIIELMNARQETYQSIHFLGNSLGIDEIRVIDELKCLSCSWSDLSDQDWDGNTAPNPGEYWCESEEQWVQVNSTSRMFSRKETDWVEWKRIWETLRKDYGDKFQAHGHEYDDKMNTYLPLIEQIEGEPVPDLLDVITGQNIRIEDPSGTSYYANVMNKNPLVRDELPELLDLKTMQPITVTRDWRVVEVV